MKKYHIRRCLFSILVLVISLASIGCSKVTAQEIVTNVLNFYSKVKTYSVEENLYAVTEVVGGDQPGTRIISHNGTGIINIENRQIEMDIMNDGQPIYGMKTFTQQYLINE